jgi:hypothetical protein
MPEDKEREAGSTTKASREEQEEERVTAEADDEEDTEGHVSITDTWLPSNNKWKRRR